MKVLKWDSYNSPSGNNGMIPSVLYSIIVQQIYKLSLKYLIYSMPTIHKSIMQKELRA